MSKFPLPTSTILRSKELSGGPGTADCKAFINTWLFSPLFPSPHSICQSETNRDGKTIASRERKLKRETNNAPPLPLFLQPAPPHPTSHQPPTHPPRAAAPHRFYGNSQKPITRLITAENRRDLLPPHPTAAGGTSGATRGERE